MGNSNVESLKDFPYTLEPGQRVVIHRRGTHIHCAEAKHKIFVSVNDGEALTMTEGIGISYVGEFTRVELVNGDTAQPVTVYVGHGELTDSRQYGEVDATVVGVVDVAFDGPQPVNFDGAQPVNLVEQSGPPVKVISSGLPMGDDDATIGQFGSDAGRFIITTGDSGVYLRARPDGDAAAFIWDLERGANVNGFTLFPGEKLTIPHAGQFIVRRQTGESGMYRFNYSFLGPGGSVSPYNG